MLEDEVCPERIKSVSSKDSAFFNRQFGKINMKNINFSDECQIFDEITG